MPKIQRPRETKDKGMEENTSGLMCYEREKLKVLVTQLCLTLCDPMDCSPPGSSVHGILQARVTEWVAISFSRACSWHRDWTQVSYLTGISFTVSATSENVLWIYEYQMKYMLRQKNRLLGIKIMLKVTLNIYYWWFIIT